MAKKHVEVFYQANDANSRFFGLKCAPFEQWIWIKCATSNIEDKKSISSTSSTFEDETWEWKGRTMINGQSTTITQLWPSHICWKIRFRMRNIVTRKCAFWSLFIGLFKHLLEVLHVSSQIYATIGVPWFCSDDNLIPKGALRSNAS